jgi:gliding motility-associated-like protein
LWNLGNETHESGNVIRTSYSEVGDFFVTLYVEDANRCFDSITKKIHVYEELKVFIPNAFTPNEDGYNDRFIVDARSLRYLNVEIFSRSGLKVYGYSGDSDRIKSWEGWDGKVNNSSIEARPGIYLYIIRALGWDDLRYDSKEYRGFLYLYR